MRPPRSGWKACENTDRQPNEASHQLRITFFGSDNPWEDGQTYLDFYWNHLDAVRAYAKGEAIPLLELCWEDGDGWPELCAFLGHDPVNGPIPHANSADLGSRLATRARRKLGRLIRSMTG